jgi:hypothetical protein
MSLTGHVASAGSMLIEEIYPHWEVVVDNPQNHYLLIRVGRFWWAKYYVAQRPRLDMFGQFSGIKTITEPMRNKKYAMTVLKMME